ncbi:hypothetical protein FHS51_001428 [Sphingobium wenxiniae]|uniref:DUF7936 domain-containing protein n=1 Tax=Sphingobium wenxiniae (strain DSM 21828 / CGMCC 1.7748 / JZ-1) TaxID=595605 RepID=A0A562KL56_SPHWJ|nr:hypothetical protein [Sphingobium wenxiniae]MBB6191206.1 hypothetical protein [Sphingobium wenxiniae]TWH95995.1 hypothetical protein IQ35_01084 [Sphingobium wenxiniae]
MIYSWNFPALHVARHADGLSNVVTDVDWMLSASDDEGHSAAITGRVGIADPDAGSFTDFDSLTTEQVQGWVEDQLGSEAGKLKAMLDARIAEMIDPPVAILTPPWAAQQTDNEPAV